MAQRLYNMSINRLRDDHTELNPATSGYEPAILLEYYSRNGLQGSDSGATGTFATVVDNSTIGPDNVTNGFSVAEDTNTVYHGFQANPVPNGSAGVAYTVSFHAKAGTRTRICVIQGALPDGTNEAIIDLSAGTIIRQGTAITVSTLKNCGNGWWSIECRYAYSGT